MLASRLLPHQLILPAWTLGHQCNPRWLHDAKRGWAKWEGETWAKYQELRQGEHKNQELNDHEAKYRGFRQQKPKFGELRHKEPQNQKPQHKEPKSQEPRYQEPKHRRLSLFEELFPEEVKKYVGLEKKVDDTEERVPRLPLPELDEVDIEDGYTSGQERPSDITKAASRKAFRQWNLAILIIQRASKSLIESDFRRIAPKGQHIEDWKGPGDPLKGVILRNNAHYLTQLLTNRQSDPRPRSIHPSTPRPLLPPLSQPRLCPRLPKPHHSHSPSRNHPHAHLSGIPHGTP